MWKSAALLAGAVASACSPPPASPATTDVPVMLLRTYAIPAGSAQQLKAVINGVLYNEGKPVGHATLAPDGQLVLVAPEGVQQGVRSLVEGLSKSGPPPSPSAFEVTYWLVLGHPVSKAPPVPESLREIASAMDAVKAAEGPMELATLEHLRLQSNADEIGEINGRVAHVHQLLGLAGGKVTGQINISLGPAHLETHVALGLDQTLVLGETGYDVDPKRFHPSAGEPALGDDQDVRLFYVVRAAVRDGKTP
jgi:hypothetical protein